MKKAVVLLSGGLDSATALYWAKDRSYQCYALLFDYGQRHKRELISARAVAKSAQVFVERVQISLPWKGSALTDQKLKIPHHRFNKIGRGGIPLTYVPARNTIFLSFALSWADSCGAEAVVIGANALDYSGYPDCRPAYFKAVQKVSRLGTKSGVGGKTIKILTPLIKMSKKEIVKLGIRLGVPFEKTWSCYAGKRRPCGKCDSCQLREKGFREAGSIDPL